MAGMDGKADVRGRRRFLAWSRPPAGGSRPRPEELHHPVEGAGCHPSTRGRNRLSCCFEQRKRPSVHSLAPGSSGSGFPFAEPSTAVRLRFEVMRALESRAYHAIFCGQPPGAQFPPLGVVTRSKQPNVGRILRLGMPAEQPNSVPNLDFGTRFSDLVELPNRH